MKQLYMTPASGLECDRCGLDLQNAGFEHDTRDGFYICCYCGSKTPDDCLIEYEPVADN